MDVIRNLSMPAHKCDKVPCLVWGIFVNIKKIINA
jgi:hypothetical protein